MKITNLSPKATPERIRSYLVKDHIGKTYLVRVTPKAGDVNERTAVCDCSDFKSRRAIRCLHIRAVSPIDTKRFENYENQNHKNEDDGAAVAEKETN